MPLLLCVVVRKYKRIKFKNVAVRDDFDDMFMLELRLKLTLTPEMGGVLPP